MSATGRNPTTERDVLDYYATPSWCVEAIAPYLDLDATELIVDPGCGAGAIGVALRAAGFGGELHGIDIHGPRVEQARQTAAYTEVQLGDFTEDLSANPTAAVLSCGNPPYSQAMAFLRHALAFGDACFLLRQGFMSSKKRATWLKAQPFDLYVLSERPSFCWLLRWHTRCSKCDAKRKIERRVAPGTAWPDDPIPDPCCDQTPVIVKRDRITSDATDYGWLCWRHEGPREKGVVIL